MYICVINRDTSLLTTWVVLCFIYGVYKQSVHVSYVRLITICFWKDNKANILNRRMTKNGDLVA